MKYYMGIDGGGSKTTVLICDENGKAAAVYTGKGINSNTVGMRAAKKNLAEAVRGAIAIADVPLTAAFIGSAALSARADTVYVQDFCGDVFYCDNIAMDSDVFIALEAMRRTGPCAVVICGTGSMAAGRDPNGRIIHTGGWGPVLGDEGSGYALALDAIKAGIRGAEKSGPPTKLSDVLADYFSVKDYNDLLPLFYENNVDTCRVAGFAPFLFDVLQQGDAVAKEITDKHMLLLFRTAAALLRQLPENTPLGLWGGILQHQAYFRDGLSRLIKSSFPNTEICLLPYPPEYGAAFAAMALEDIDGRSP